MKKELLTEVEHEHKNKERKNSYYQRSISK